MGNDFLVKPASAESVGFKFLPVCGKWMQAVEKIEQQKVRFSA